MPTKPSTLVRAVMAALEVEGATALARALGMTDYNAPRKIKDWLDDKFSPNYEATMLMLEGSGLLNLEAGDPEGAATDPSPLSARQRYLLKAAEGDGLAAQELASVFNATEEEIQAELRAARDELASWQETRGEEETEPPERQPLPEEPDPAKASAEDLQKEKETLRKVVFELTGGALPENFSIEDVPYLTTILSVKADLEKRVESLEQAAHPAKPETE